MRGIGLKLERGDFIAVVEEISARLAATSMGSQPISEASPQPVRPSAAVTAMKTQLVLAETLKTCVSMREMVLMAAV